MPLKKCFPCLKFRDDEVITKLDCSNTFLTDVFPNFWQHERTLEELYLTSTRINSLPPQLFYCQSLRILMVNSNNLENIPDAIGSLRHLNRLNFSRNLISNVPDSIKTCKNLTHLDLCCNNLQRLPDAITCLISLQELLLNETYLEFLPANFGRLVNLRILELRLNNLITLPKSMARLSNLHRLDIGGNEFTELPDVIGELKQLRELWIDFNQIRRISPNIAKLRELQHFEANGNLIDALPSEISHWRSIEVLSICTNNLESLPFSVACSMMKSLVTLKCESNDLRELPDSISNLENLEELVLSHNQLLRLPATIGMLRKLRFLFADGNEIRALPDEICSCSNLGVLSVSRNKITELPQNIGHLTKLKVLNLVNNNICHLPVSILSLVNLTSLWISDNQSQPLVPLQYLDASKKTKLTCFMLPQQNTASVEAYEQQQEQNYDSNATQYKNQSNKQQQQPTHINRICFAEEATILSGASQVNNENLTLNLDPLTEHHMGVRLMRSPTPYPKELRLMSRYVRNGPKPAHKLPDDALSTQQSDGVVLNSNNCEMNIPTESINSAMQLAQTHTDMCALQGNISYAGQEQQPNNEQNQQQFYAAYYIAPSNINEFQGSEIAHNYKILSLPTQSQENQQEKQPRFMSNCYNSNDRTLIQQPEPPPYHIACVYTKKSSEDLTMYERNRNQQQQLEHQKQQNSQFLQQQSYLTMHDVDQQDTILQLPHESSTIGESLLNSNSSFHLNQYNETLTTCDHQNNIMPLNQLCKTSSSKLVVDNATETLRMQQLNATIEQEQSNDKLTEDSEKSVGSIYKKPSATPWLFGVHKNPTVKQVTLKWENIIGFAIDEIPNKEGIFISSIVPNTHAARLLSIHDKLLEIDGFDLSNMHINEVRKIILSAGSSINIMLSRK